VREAGPGAVLLGHEVPEAAVLAGARAARGPIVLNPAPARPLADALAALGPVLTPNAGEACELTGEREHEAAGRALAARTGAAVLVTLGARGVLVLDDGDAELLPAPRVDAVDTTGAGDAFNGALATALAEGRALREAAAFAVAAAALSTRAAGAREGMPRRDEVDA
jgi:ribokinase